MRTPKTYQIPEIGTILNNWTVISAPIWNSEKRRKLVQCRCICGVKRLVNFYDLVTNKSKCCGCIQQQHKESKYGLGFRTDISRRLLYQVWIGMKTRCYNTRDKNYHHYGAKGVTICNDWRLSFLTFENWAQSSGYKKGLTLDRTNVYGNYEPNNCRWISVAEQNGNKRSNITAFGETKSKTEWVRDERCNVTRRTLMERLSWDWTPEKAISTPRMSGNQYTSKKDSERCQDDQTTIN